MSLVVASGLTERQAEFVRHASTGMPLQAAAAAAGYKEPDLAYRIVALPHVLAAIHVAVQRRLTYDAPTSLAVLTKIRDDENAPVRVRADIGLKLLQLAGHVAPSDRNEAPGKQLQEMSAEELLAYIDRNQAEIDRLEAELMSRAKDVSAPACDPINSVVDANPLNYLD